MLKECIDVYERFKAKHGGRSLVLDNYIPSDGTYIFVEIGENNLSIKDTLTVKYDKKKDEVNVKLNAMYPFLCFCDYYSRLISMQKPMDKKKTIHTNSYLAFAVKQDCAKEGKLTEDLIDGYYNALEDPLANKYSSDKNTKAVYKNIEEKIGVPDTYLIKRIRSWIKENVYNILAGMNSKAYLKIFFIYPDRGETEKAYSRERERYLIPNVYNANDYNRVINGETYGVPNNDISLNSNKPFLCNKTRKTEIPYLVRAEAVLKQNEFYEYLLGLVSAGRNCIYFDTTEGNIIPCRRNESPDCTVNGYVMWAEKGKSGANICSIDTVADYNPNLRPPFIYKRITDTRKADLYGMVNRKDRLESLIDEMFFFKMLRNNYFSKPKSFPSTMDGTVLYNLLRSRDMLFSWFHKGGGTDVAALIDAVTEDLVLNSIRKGYRNKAIDQMNLRWSLMDYFLGNNEMEEFMMDVRDAMERHIVQKDYWTFESDEEFYYGVGQMAAYLISRSKAKDKPLSLVNPFLQCGDAAKIKSMLERLFIKYSHTMSFKDVRAKQLYGSIMGYTPKTKPNTSMISAGFASSSVIYIKTNDTEED